MKRSDGYDERWERKIQTARTELDLAQRQRMTRRRKRREIALRLLQRLWHPMPTTSRPSKVEACL